MSVIKKVLGIVHVAYAVLITALFLGWRVVDGIPWDVVNVVSAVVIVLSLYFAWERKRRYDAAGGDSMDREYYESNLLFYLAVVLIILFAFNWFNILANGASDVGAEVMHDVAWVIVDLLIAVVSGAIGTHLLRTSAAADGGSNA